MSDLHRAVEAEIRAFTPDRTPPLSALKARKRSRDRRRFTVAGAALSVVAVSGIAGGSAFLSEMPDLTSSVAVGPAGSGSAEGVVFDVLPVTSGRVDDARFGVGVDACVRLPGTSDLAELMSVHPAYQVTVTGADAVEALRSCVDQVVGYAATVATEIVQPPEAAPGVSAESVARLCAVAAETFDGQVAGAYPTTVEAVRAYMQAPPSTGYTLAAPGPSEANPFPPSWSSRKPETRAAACYIDADFPTPGPPGRPPAERALIMAANGASPFLVKAGPKDSIIPAPLPLAPPEPTVAPPTPTAVTPGRTDFSECLSVPSDPAACTENLPEPGQR